MIPGWPPNPRSKWEILANIFAACSAGTLLLTKAWNEYKSRKQPEREAGFGEDKKYSGDTSGKQD